MLRLLSTAALLLISTQTANAQDLLAQYQDQIRGQIEQGWKHLSARDLNKAANSFSQAGGIVRMVRSKELETLLPLAPEGWTRKQKTDEEYINEGAAGNLMGGMSMVSGTYTKGEKSVDVTIVGESEMLRTLVEFAKISPDNNFDQKERYNGGFLEFKESPLENQISIMLLKPATNIQIDGKGMTKEEGLVFADLLDIESIKKAMSEKTPNKEAAE